MVSAFGSALGSQLAVFPEESGQFQLLEVVLKELRGLVAHAALPDSRVMQSWARVVFTLTRGR